MSSDFEPWEPEMNELLDAAKVDVEPPLEARRRIAARLALEATDLRASANPPRSSWRRWARSSVALAAAVALGMLLHALLRPAAPLRQAAIQPQHGTMVPLSGSMRMLGGFASSDRELLDEASRRMARGDLEGAITSLEGHVRSFPKSPFSELREALFIEALARAGRAVEARARAARFAEIYPESLLAPAVADALLRISDK
jgi:hypothetical protein